MRYELNSDEDKIIDIEAIGDNGVLGLKDCCKIMNEQEATIQQQERKIRKCEAEVGRQLKQIIELQDELNECRARPTLATDEKGFVKIEYK